MSSFTAVIGHLADRFDFNCFFSVKSSRFLVPISVPCVIALTSRMSYRIRRSGCLNCVATRTAWKPTCGVSAARTRLELSRWRHSWWRQNRNWQQWKTSCIRQKNSIRKQRNSGRPILTVYRSASKNDVNYFSNNNSSLCACGPKNNENNKTLIMI